ncbi:TerB family tellurite resistance protein [Endozoicomonas sp. G2_1]|uniref:tellurite resistance TerB family protein n=1 Tax=Endozoicomonas sp. G2_1 TaxID=2821091 RepID=UPI001ADA43AC|nr:TerB family tellurite resistance protein [Endozoicomonas sp. G2_1]MBO9490868.1 TerB family tellurite resistance protein [Endozoicomonas sp. G2_1]
MLSILKKLISDIEQDHQTDQYSIEAACTALLCEVMRADGHLDAEEKSKLNEIISDKFSLTAQETAEIIEESMALSDQAIDLYQFTSVINQHYNTEQRIEVVKLLWQLAYADQELAAIEQHTIRKISDLLHLRHSEYIQAKQAIGLP